MKKLFYILIFFGCIAQLAAAEASVVFLAGSATARPVGGSSAPISNGYRVAEGTEISTGPKSTLILQIPGGHQIKIREKTVFSLTLINQSKAGDAQVHLGIRSGGVFSKVAKLSDKSTYIVRTPTSVAGVRGTEFFVAHESSDQTWLCVKEGQVDVATDAAPHQVTTVTAGLGVSVATEVSEPMVQEWTEGLNWNFDPKSEVADNTRIGDESYQRKLLRMRYD